MPETRRQFLKRIVFGSETAVEAPGEHALVCVFLRGGADTLNMLVPYGDATYYKVRPHIAIPQPKSTKGLLSNRNTLRLDDFHGFHPAMKPLLPSFLEGRLAIIQAVGSDNPTGSHFEAQDQMERGESYQQTVGGGWLGRFLRQRLRSDCGPLAATAIGTSIPESLRGAPTATALTSIDQLTLKCPTEDPVAISRTLAALYAADVGVLSQPGLTTLKLLQKVERLRKPGYVPSNGAKYPDSSFGKGLREIARLIKAGVGLEVACVDLGGWDTHFFQGGVEGQQAALIAELANGVAAFEKDVFADDRNVTVLVMTEFGRRTYENGSTGTDHGRGFAFFALGSHLNGGKVYGVWPGLEDDQYALGPGGLRITTDYRSVLGELLSATRQVDLDKVFPRLVFKPLGLTADV